jgi:hypothetical protein
MKLHSILPEVGVLGLSALVRIFHVLSSPFPLGDGGLFLLMTEKLQADQFALPTTVAYNGLSIPFAYPPLGFYAAGLTAEWFDANPLSVMRFLPLVLSCATVVVVWGFARSVLQSRLAVLAATFAFGALPLAYRYFIMGAGITRSPGLLFAVITIWVTYLLCVRGRAWLIGPLAIAAALTVLSHPNAAWFAAYSSALVVAFHCRARGNLGKVFVAVAGAGLLIAPWFATAISRHGLAPYLSASQSGNPGPSALELWLRVELTQEAPIPILALLATIGLIVCARDSKWWLPAWLLAACALDTRYSGTFAMVPLAFLVGIGLRFLADELWARSPQGSAARASTLAVAFWLAVLTLAGTLSPGLALRELPPSNREAMAWVASETPQEAVFLVVAPTGVSAGSESEWFPVLSQRRSLGTYQGVEWFPQSSGPSPWERYDQLQRCGGESLRCLEEWARQIGQAFDYVFVREAGTQPLRDSLLASDEFSLAHTNGDVMIFARRHHDRDTQDG